MHLDERHKTIILLRVSTGPKPPRVARGQRSGSAWATHWPVLFGPSERNKMTEVLLRSLSSVALVSSMIRAAGARRGLHFRHGWKKPRA